MRSSAEFALVRTRGRSLQGRFLRVSALRSPQSGQHARFGLVTSRKVGGAVERNLVRRRLREIIRSVRPSIAPGLWIVSIARPAAAGANFSELREEWLILARRLSIFRDSA